MNRKHICQKKQPLQIAVCIYNFCILFANDPYLKLKRNNDDDVVEGRVSNRNK